MRTTVTTWLAALLSPAAVFAQDPSPPPGGYGVVEVVDQLVTWSDGYRTRMDLYRPDALAPPTGWPAVLANHGGGGDRKLPDVVAMGRYLAAAGYVVYAFDGRTNGETRILNPGWAVPITLERIILDQAESHGQAQGFLAGFIDGSRIAVTGVSGGGRRSFEAAAYSGKPLPLAGAVTHYPVVRAVAPEIAILDYYGTAAPGGVLASDFVIQNLAPTDPILLALQAGDYATFLTLIHEPVHAGLLLELQTSTVPIFAMVACQDVKVRGQASLDAFAALPPTLPRRLFLSTGGHSTVKNTHERAIQQDLRRRWFDHYLKGIANGADREARVEIAVQPSSTAEHAATGSIWEHRNDQQWPPAIVPTRMYLRAGGVLRGTAPVAAAPGPVIRHRVQPGFDVITYVGQGGGRRPDLLLPLMPRKSVALDAPPVPVATELVGRSVVDLHVDDSTGIFQLSAALFQVDPTTGEETWIAMGTNGARGAAGPQTLRIEIDDVAHVIPAGHHLRLRITNLADHSIPGGGRRVRIVPYFTDTDTRVLIEPAAASAIDLPLRPYRSNLGPRLATAQASAGIAHSLDLRGGAGRAGQPYAVFLGASGEGPGVMLPGLPTIPFNPDTWTLVGIALQNTAAFPMAVGVLDASGRGAPGMVLPAGALTSALAGQRFTFAGVVLGGGTIESVAGPATLVVDP